METDFLALDKDARRDALNPAESCIVQAPAGSGKTELLIQRYLRLLSIVDEPEEIVAITFTRKAAQEMRHRVVEALVDAASNTEIVEDYQHVTRDAARIALQRDSAREWNIIESPRRLRIQTMDSFNSSIARSLPVSSGLGGITRTIADTEMQSLYRQAALLSLDWMIADDALSDSVSTLLRHLDSNVSAYVSYLANMLQGREQWMPLLGSGIAESSDYDVPRQTLEAGIQQLISEQLSKIRNLLPRALDGELIELIDYAAGNLNAASTPVDALTQIGSISALPDTECIDRHGWIAIADLCLTQTGSIRKSITKANGFPPADSGQKKRFMEILEALQSVRGFDAELHRARMLPSPVYSEDQWAVLVALFRMLPVAVAELRGLFSARTVCDHTEVALSAAAVMRSGNAVDDIPGDAAMMLDYKIQHLLVDEMQDTSVGQYRFLEQLTEGWTPHDGRTFFGVGDPMQSIYRFRDAEVAQFVLAREEGIGSLRPGNLVLRRNFRSGEKLVHWFNSAFKRIMPKHDDLGAGAIAYTESIPVDKHAGGGSIHVHPLIDFGVKQEALYGANLIQSCIDEYPEDSVAVLVRSRTQLQDLLPELRKKNVAYHAVDIDKLTDLPEVIDLLALTRALCHDGDRIAWLGLLHGPLVGLTWHDILALVGTEPRKSVRELIADDSNLAKLSESGQARIRAFIAEVDRHSGHSAVEMLRDRVEKCWYGLGGPATLRDANELANAYQYLDVLGKLEVAGSLPDVGELQNLLDQERVSSSPGPGCNLQIMTMHKSKGLQFDHVLLLGLGRATRGNQKAVLNWMMIPDSDAGRLVMSPVGSRSDIDSDPLHRYIEIVEKDKQDHELDRLLYVACTRARHSLYLVGDVSLSSKGELAGPRSGSLLERLWPSVAANYDASFAMHDGNAEVLEDTADTLLVDPVSRRFVSPWVGSPPAKLPGQRDFHDPVESNDREVEYYWVGSLARQAGTIVHRWLQLYSRDKREFAPQNREKVQGVSERWARDLGVPEADVSSVCERVQDALDAVSADPQGRWVVSGEGHTELPLTGIWKGEVSSVIIDRVRVDDDGSHWIVDYKTSSHEGGDLQGFLMQESERYRPQLDKYAALYTALYDVPVRKALYFPLLQHLLEI